MRFAVTVAFPPLLACKFPRILGGRGTHRPAAKNNAIYFHICARFLAEELPEEERALRVQQINLTPPLVTKGAQTATTTSVLFCWF